MYCKTKTLKLCHLHQLLLLGVVLSSPVWFVTPRVLAQSIGEDITSLDTTDTTGSTSSTSGVRGGSNDFPNPTSPAYPNGTYQVNYGGKTRQIDEFTTSSGERWSTIPGAIPYAVINRRLGTDDRQAVWHRGTYNSGTKTFSLETPGKVDERSALQANNLFLGTENLFANTNGGQNNYSTIERIDFIFDNPIVTGDDNGFAIFDRGTTNSHDGFKIAAITSLDPDYNTANGFGSLQSLSNGTWGQTALNGTQGDYIAFNNSEGYPSKNRNIPENPSGQFTQSLGGRFIRSQELTNNTPGQTIYGYSLFAADVTNSCGDLVNLTSSCYSTTTSESNGGLDLVGANLGNLQRVPFGLSPGLGLAILGVWGAGIKFKSQLRQGIKTHAKRVLGCIN